MSNQWLKLSEGLFFFGNGGINRIETIDNRYGDTVYNTILFHNNTKLGSAKETVEDIQKLLDNVREKKEN